MKIKPILIFSLVLLVIVTLSTFYFLNSKNQKIKSVQTQQSNANSEELTVLPQTPADTVTVEKTVLSKDSYLVVREIIDGKLGQIIEISNPLKKGTHKNIQITLGNANIKNVELIVMVYDDQNSDGMFNDFDQPTIDENGKMIARYVKTGEAIPESIAEGENAGMNHNMAGMAKMVKVTYTDKGFVPEKIEVPVGSMVQFINESDKEMWVASSPHPSHTDLPTFDQFKPTKKGSVYRYVFDKKGAWKYHDHINASVGGVVTVI